MNVVNNVLVDARKGVVAFLGGLSLVLELGFLHGQALHVALLTSAVLTGVLPYLVPNGPLALGLGDLAASVEKGTGFVADIPQPVVDVIGPVLKSVQDQMAKLSPEDRAKLAVELTQSAAGVSGSAVSSLAPEQTPAGPVPPPAAPEPPAAPVA